MTVLDHIRTMSRSHLITLGVLFAALIIAAVGTVIFVRDQQNKVLEETAAIFSDVDGEAAYTDLLGNPVSLEQYLGKVMVVASWASWSPFSQNDLQMLSELGASYEAQHVSFLAINRKETKEQATRYVSTFSAIDKVVVVLDPRDHFYTSIGGYAMPELVVYNQKGEVVRHFRGVAPKAEIQSVVDELLKSS